MKNFMYLTLLMLFCLTPMLDIQAQTSKSKLNQLRNGPRMQRTVQKQKLTRQLQENNKKLYNVSYDMSKLNATYSQMVATSDRNDRNVEVQHLCPVTYKASPHSNKIRIQVDFGNYVMTGQPGGNRDRISKREHYVNFGVRVLGSNRDNDIDESIILSRRQGDDMDEIVTRTGRNVFVEEFTVTPGETLTITPFIKCISKIESSEMNGSARNMTLLTGTIHAIKVEGFF